MESPRWPGKEPNDTAQTQLPLPGANPGEVRGRATPPYVTDLRHPARPQTCRRTPSPSPAFRKAGRSASHVKHAGSSSLASQQPQRRAYVGAGWQRPFSVRWRTGGGSALRRIPKTKSLVLPAQTAEVLLRGAAGAAAGALEVAAAALCLPSAEAEAGPFIYGGWRAEGPRALRSPSV